MDQIIIGGYRITNILGEGGMGAVYAGEHTKLGRQAAIKLLLPEYSHDTEIVGRFFNEARAATAIKHPGIVQIYDFGYQQDGSAYIAMEYLQGEGLDARLKRLGWLPVQQALRFAGQMASALAAAHNHGIIHRDLKPANVFIVPDAQVPGGERIKLLDFGIAKFSMPDSPNASQTRAGTVMGSPLYMAPEQCRGAGEVDYRADLYALGCILFHMLCARPPFDGGGNGVIAIMSAQLHEYPPVPSLFRPELTPEIDRLVLQLLAKDPAYRPASGSDLGNALAAISGEPVSFLSLPGITGNFGQMQGHNTGSVPGHITASMAGQIPGQMQGQITGSMTGSIPGQAMNLMAAGITGHVTGNQLGAGQFGTTGHQAGRSQISQSHVQTMAVNTRKRRVFPAVLVTALVAGSTIFALTQLGGPTAPKAPPTTTVAEVTETAPAPPEVVKPKPRLIRYESVVEEVGPDGKRQSKAGSAAGSAIASTDVVAPLPAFSLATLLSGSYLDGLMGSLSLLIGPQPVLVTWQIATSPPGAEVIQAEDGKVVGTTERPMLITLEQTPGYVQSFTLRLPRHQDKVIQLSGDASFSEVVALEPKVYATVISKPAGAEVLDAQGKSLGTAPLEVELSKEGGAVGLTLRRERYEDTPVSLSGDKSFEQKVELPPKVYATIQSQPKGAEVLDAQGNSLGTAPVELELPRAAQPVHVILRRERYEDTPAELSGQKSFKKTIALVPRVYATVASKPAGAQVFDASGNSLGTAPVELELPRDAGPMRVTLKHEGHEDATAELAGKKSFKQTVKLVPRVALTIESKPAGAEVFDASGTSLGTAPVTVEHAQGADKLAFTLKLAGYQDAKVEVSAKRKQQTVVALEPVPEPAKPVTIRIDSKPPQAEVWKDGVLLGKAPVEDSFLGQKDKVTYVLKLKDHQEAKVRLDGDRDGEKLVELSPKCAKKQRSRGSLTLVNPYDDPC